MHMADALVVPAVAGTMYVLSGAAACCSVKKIKLENEPKKIAAMGVMGAFVFAAQMINFSIPGTGSSGHLCGGMLLTAMLGPWAGFLSMTGILLIQCLLFADGGLLALGCNIWNMAFYGCFIGGFLIWRPFMRNGMTKKRIITASVIACVLTLQLGAFSVTIETLLSGITELPFTVFAAVMQPIHLAIGLVEGVVTAAVLCFVYEARPELLWTGKEDVVFPKEEKGGTAADLKRQGRLSFRTTLVVLAVTAGVTAGGFSLLASSKPDGLEWSMEKTAGTTELEGSGNLQKTAEAVQNATALLPDYTFPAEESNAGTTVAGLTGAAIVLVCLVAFCYIIRVFRKRQYGRNGKSNS